MLRAIPTYRDGTVAETPQKDETQEFKIFGDFIELPTSGRKRAIHWKEIVQLDEAEGGTLIRFRGEQDTTAYFVDYHKLLFHLWERTEQVRQDKRGEWP